MAGYYDVAQICLNGHVINASVHQYPQHSSPFCDQCGAKGTTTCECGANIRGRYDAEGVISFSKFKAPAYCNQCGRAYPWTESRLAAAHELVNEAESLSAEEKEALSASIGDLVKDSPRTTVAATRYGRLVTKAGNVIGGALRDILVDVVSESAKKIVFPL